MSALVPTTTILPVVFVLRDSPIFAASATRILYASMVDSIGRVPFVMPGGAALGAGLGAAGPGPGVACAQPRTAPAPKQTQSTKDGNVQAQRRNVFIETLLRKLRLFTVATISVTAVTS